MDEPQQSKRKAMTEPPERQAKRVQRPFVTEQAQKQARIKRAAQRVQREARYAKREQEARLERIERAAGREARRAQMPDLKSIHPTTIALRREVQSCLYPYEEQGYLQQEDVTRKKTDGSQILSTKNVKRTTLNLLEKSDFGKKFLGEPEILPVYPIGFISRCHKNAIVFSQLNDNFEPVVGYTIVACPCQRHGTLELHSVVKNKKTEKLYDITDDVYDEQEKWFVPIKCEFIERLKLYELIEFGKCLCNPIHECAIYSWYGTSSRCPHITDKCFK